MVEEQNVLVVYEIVGDAAYYTTAKGERVKPPESWGYLPAGDAGVTRRVTKGGFYWKVCYLKGRHLRTKGIWADSTSIAEAQATMVSTRASESYQKKLESGRASRARAQERYVDEFRLAILQFLNFPSQFTDMADQMATRVSDHATPVGSGTVARTAMIPVEERARKAVIAWMRHATTPYDSLAIARIKGERRRVRGELAQKSIVILNHYRQGRGEIENCPLWRAVYAIK